MYNIQLTDTLPTKTVAERGPASQTLTHNKSSNKRKARVESIATSKRTCITVEEIPDEDAPLSHSSSMMSVDSLVKKVFTVSFNLASKI